MGNKVQTQDKLIAATRDIILTSGIEACSVENICQHAGFTRGAFYSNFSRKESLLEALAENEYDHLVDLLERKVRAWSTQGIGDNLPPENTYKLMEKLLIEVFDAIGIDRNLYILHSLLLIRSIQDPQWGTRLFEVNTRFVTQLGRVLVKILQLAGRKVVVPIDALAHAVIGIAIRAAGIRALKTSLVVAASTLPNPTMPLSSLPANCIAGQKAAARVAQVESTSVAASPVKDLVTLILVLLIGASRPLDTPRDDLQDTPPHSTTNAKA